MSSAGRDALVAMLSRLKGDLASVNLGKPTEAQAALQTKYPLVGDYLVEVRRLCERGVEEGWLCFKESGGVRFSRLAPPSKYFPYSVDAVELEGSGRAHVHPKGEVNIAWPISGKPKFCGKDPGWAVFAPGSRHVPEVKGGKMLLLYFLPGGEIEWLPVASTKRTAAERTTKKTAAKRATKGRAASGSRRKASPARAARS